MQRFLVKKQTQIYWLIEQKFLEGTPYFYLRIRMFCEWMQKFCFSSKSFLVKGKKRMQNLLGNKSFVNEQVFPGMKNFFEWM